MKSKKPGKNISDSVEILNLSRFGLWLFAQGKEYFLSYKNYPWFQNATVVDIYNFKLSSSGRAIHWPDLDIDLEIESLDNLEKYSLTSKVSAPSTIKRRRKKAA